MHNTTFIGKMYCQLADCMLIGVKGYLSSSIQLGLFSTVNIRMETPMRKTHLTYKKQAWIFRKARKRAKTLFSQLCDQFMINGNYAKSLGGFKLEY